MVSTGIVRRSSWRGWLEGGVRLFPFIIAGLLLYARLYGDPAMYESDNLMGEDIYRDLFIKKNPWSQWGLPGAAQYVELALYFGLRLLMGEVHGAMALHGAVIACLFAFSAAYAAGALFKSAAARRWVYAMAPLLAVIYPFPSAAFCVTSKLAHGQTLSAALFGCGFFLRYVERRPPLFVLLAATAGMAWMIASDALFTLWFCIPAFVMTGWLLWKRRLDIGGGLLWWGMTAAAYLFGKMLDGWLRNFPVHFNPGDFGPIRMVQNLYAIFDHTLTAAFSSPLTACWLVVGCLGLAAMLRGTVRQRDGALFFLLAMVLNALGVAASGESLEKYVALWMILPYSIGALLLVGELMSRGAAAAEHEGYARLSGRAPFIASLCVAAGLAFPLRDALAHMRLPYYPELARQFDELARTRGLRTGVTGYWDARLVTILSREGVELIPVEWDGFRYMLFNATRSMVRDRVDMLIDNPHSPPYYKLNRELELRANGQPDEIISMPGDLQVLVYHDGAHHPAEAELMLDGKRLMPDMAAGDRVQWRGELPLANGLTLREVRTAPRDRRHAALLFFKEPLAAIQGKELTVAALGDRTPSHKRRFGLRISAGADGWLDKFYFLFVPTRKLLVTSDNSVALPDGGSMAWGKLPNWNSKEWLALFVDDGESRHRIK